MTTFFPIFIDEVDKMTTFFPIFVNEEENVNILEGVSKDEFHIVFNSFQKDKSTCPYGVEIDFLLGLYEILEEVLLNPINGSRSSRKVLPSFHSTFIALILKTDNPISFDECMHNLLCNFIYNIIVNIIAMRIKMISYKKYQVNIFFYWEG